MRFLLPVLVVIITLSCSAHAQEKVFNAQSHTLDNGMEIVVIPNHRAPVITHMVWYKVGAADEKWGKSGIAHFMEHLMFKGTKDIPPGEFSKRIKALGGNDNAFTSHDYTAYFQSISVEHLETVMKMEASRMRGMSPPPEEVLSERDVVIEERRLRTENDPRTQFGEQMRYALFPNHPYGMPVIGWKEEIENLSWDDAKAFYDKWYAPNNAILVISGYVTMDDVLPLAEQIYGTLESADTPQREWTSIPPFPGVFRVELKSPQIQQPAISIAFITPSSTSEKKDSLALEVLQEIMSGGASTRLYKSLVVEQKLATSASLSYDSYSVGESTSWLSAYPAEGVSLQELEDALFKELKSVIKEGVTDNELEDAKERMIDAAIFARDSLQGPAMIFGMARASGVTIDDVEFWPHNIEKVTKEDVQLAAKKYLNPDEINDRPYVIGYLLPAEVENDH
jgi:zinc protease